MEFWAYINNSNFKAISQVHSYLTLLNLSKCVTCKDASLLRFRGTKIWNVFSHLAKNCSSIKCHKRCLKDNLTGVCPMYCCPCVHVWFVSLPSPLETPPVSIRTDLQVQVSLGHTQSWVSMSFQITHWGCNELLE